MKNSFKKIVSIAAASFMAVSMFCMSTGATTKNDLLEMAKTSPLYKYVDVSLENVISTIEITDEQADQIKPLLQEVLDEVKEDKGAAGKYYTEAQRNLVLNNLSKACDIVGLKLKVVNKNGNTLINLYNEAGEIIYQYDGNPVKDTSGAGNGYLFLIGGGVLALAAAAMFVLNRKAV